MLGYIHWICGFGVKNWYFLELTHGDLGRGSSREYSSPQSTQATMGRILAPLPLSQDIIPAGCRTSVGTNPPRRSKGCYTHLVECMPGQQKSVRLSEIGPGPSQARCTR